MSIRVLDYVQNDEDPPIDFKVKFGSRVKDLTGCTVDFIIKAPDNTISNTGHTQCDITDHEGGLCTYNFQSGDLAQVGEHFCDIQVTNIDTKPQTEYRTTKLNVRAENG